MENRVGFNILRIQSGIRHIGSISFDEHLEGVTQLFGLEFRKQIFLSVEFPNSNDQSSKPVHLFLSALVQESGPNELLKLQNLSVANAYSVFGRSFRGKFEI